MIVLASVTVGVLAGVAFFLLLSRNIVWITVGTALLSNSMILLLLAAGFPGREEPIAPFPPAANVSDPLVQALGLTAIVIGFGTTVLLLKVMLAVAESYETTDTDELAGDDSSEEGR